MSWQDLLFAVGSIVFAIALVPSIRSADKPALSTSLLTGGVLATYVVAFATLNLWYAAATDAVCVAAWFVLAWQVWSSPRLIRWGTES